MPQPGAAEVDPRLSTLYILAPLLLLGVVLAAVWLDRWSVPVILVALGLGITCGSDVLGLWHFDDARLANEIANVALVYILFHGGFSTKRADLRAVALPAGGLATWGVLLTGAATFAFLHLVLGWASETALLLGAIISSTDAAAIFSILRRQSLPPRLSSTLEIESAANDPMAILMTLLVVGHLSSGDGHGLSVFGVLLWKFIAGPAIGWLLARAALAIFDRLNPQDRGYYYVLLLAVVLLTYGIAELAQASGMLAVFVAGLVMGNRRFIYKQGVRNFSAALSVIANLGMFVMMGLLVFPAQWKGLWVDGIILYLTLTLFARPAAVWLSTFGMGIRSKERLFMSWAGLRGAVPIVLATYPVAAGLSAGEEVFNLVFFAVLLSVAIQGSTLGSLARWLGLSVPAKPQPRYGLELVAMAHSELDLIVVELPGPAGRPGPRIRDLVLPPRALLTLISRGDSVVAPSGNTRLLGLDQVTVLARAVDEDEVRAALLSPFHLPDTDRGPHPRLLDVEAGPQDSRGGGARQEHVVLVGHGRVGAVLARLLLARGVPFVVIEQDPTTTADLVRQGIAAIGGSAEDPRVLDSAGIRNAKLLLVTSAEAMAVRRVVEYAHQVNPSLEAIVRVHQDAQRDFLRAFPLTRCVQGEVELAYAMARRMLHAIGTSAIEAEAILIDARRHEVGKPSEKTRIAEIHVPATSLAIGRSLAELGLPRGALVITVARAGEFVVPSGETRLCAGDSLLVLAGADQAREIERIVNQDPAAAQ